MDNFVSNAYQTTNDSMPIYEEDPVVVTGTRIPVVISDITRNITIIKREEIEALSKIANSVPELLNYFIDMRQRNIYGVQADPSIRGSTCEQVLMLIDGTNVSDPQTGHHSLNIPISLDNIERIEILSGHGSALYGANAFGGVINIITKKEKVAHINASYGSYGTYSGNTGISYSNYNFFIQRQKSDGYRLGTDFDNWTMSINTQFPWMYAFCGYTDKDFGAYHFYGPANSKERTKTNFINITASQNFIKKFSYEPKIYLRQHFDEFVLDRDDRDRYVNTHLNYRLGCELTTYLNNVVIGSSIYQEKINSSGLRYGIKAPALGTHMRENIAFYSEYIHSVSQNRAVPVLMINIGVRTDYNSQYGQYFSPSIGLTYIPFFFPRQDSKRSGEFRFRGSAGTSFRAPSFTELYYEDPYNIGNHSLKAEKAISYEIGMDYNTMLGYEFASTVFLRDQTDLIDWGKLDTLEPWGARNIGSAVTRGCELTLKSQYFTVTYTFINIKSSLPYGYHSKYIFNAPKHQIGGRIMQNLPFGIELTCGTRFKKKDEEAGYLVADVQLIKKIGISSIAVSCTNVLDTKYEEIIGIGMPGRWFAVDAKLSY